VKRSEIRTRILEALNESASSPVFFSTAQIDAVIDEAQEVLSEEAQAVKRTAYQALRDGTTYYYTRGIASDIMAPYRIWLTHLDRRLVAVSLRELDVRHEHWIDVNGDPEVWFPVSWDLFGIWPSPATGGGVMRIDYLAWPRSLQDDDDEPEIRRADHDALVLYGVYDGLMKGWSWQRATEIFNLFMDRWADARARAGIKEAQARTFQRGTADTPGFRSGVLK
jgi:hypothetical protein